MKCLFLSIPFYEQNHVNWSYSFPGRSWAIDCFSPENWLQALTIGLNCSARKVRLKDKLNSLGHKLGWDRSILWVFRHFFPVHFLYNVYIHKSYLISDIRTKIYFKASLVAQTVKRLPTMQETRVRSLGCEVPLEKEITTHSSILAWKIPWMGEPGRLQSMGSQRVGHNWATSFHFVLQSNIMIWVLPSILN